MSDFFKNKVVAITGGSSGIGKSLVDLLLVRGASIATCGRHYDKLYQLQSEYPSSPLYTTVTDVSNENDCRNFIESAINVYGGIDILINNAGVSMQAMAKEVSTEALRKVMDVNFFGSVSCTRYALASLEERKGIIVGVSSVAGSKGLAGRSACSASKFALQGWLESLRAELKDSGVHILWVYPRFTASARNEEGRNEAGSPAEESRITSLRASAERILFAIEKKKSDPGLSFTGKKSVFIHKFFPGLADKLARTFY